MGAALLDVKTAVKAACVTLFPDALVTFGHPGYSAGLPNDIVAVGNVSASEIRDNPTIGKRPTRARDEIVAVEVIVSCYRGGSDQLTPTTAAAGMLDDLIDYCAATTTTALGGVCLWSYVSDYDLVESDDPEDMAAGRVAEITITVTARCRK